MVSLLLLAAVLVACAAWWVNQPLTLREPVIDLPIEPGTTPRGIARLAVHAGVDTSSMLLYGWFKVSGQARMIKAGNYELQGSVTPRSLLAMLVRGDQALRYVTLVEGWTFRQVRAALGKADQLLAQTAGMTDLAIMQALGREGVAPEGRFYPDTYGYPKGGRDLDVLKRSLLAMDRHLDLAWQGRSPDSVLKTPDQLLILASIVEKETGRASDRTLVASVFHNRLALGMPLQTDPTVIYGMGDAFDGNLRRRDLQTDTPFNTYTRKGLPPTPIAMPGRAALLAAAQPASSKALYFVARGDGSTEFSDNLQAHNRAVNKYQRGQ